MEKSAGLVILKDNKILLCHPTNARWNGTFSIPKGRIKKGESKKEAAIRETKEEVGININKYMIDNKKKCIKYKDKKGKTYKKVYYFVVELSFLKDYIPKEQLQLEEVDHAAFYDYETAKRKIFWRFKPLLELIEPKKIKPVI
jgi:ADP-ribose pyrophosphatase YjhB (NUDIX family)